MATNAERDRALVALKKAKEKLEVATAARDETYNEYDRIVDSLDKFDKKQSDAWAAYQRAQQRVLKAL